MRVYGVERVPGASWRRFVPGSSGVLCPRSGGGVLANVPFEVFHGFVRAHAPWMLKRREMKSGHSGDLQRENGKAVAARQGAALSSGSGANFVSMRAESPGDARCVDMYS